MRNLYIFLTITIILTVILLAFTFLLFEKEKHQSYYYTIEANGVTIGYIKVDRYKTEDKIIYKSTSFRPMELTRKVIHEKFIFDKKSFKLEKFSKEYKDFGVIIESAYISNKDDMFDFLIKSGSKFIAGSRVVHSKDLSIFDVESIVTYMTFVEKYNFSRGGAQSFNMLYPPVISLPPARGRAVFASQRDEYISVNGKKTKTEYLVVRSKMLPETYIWVSKKDKSIVQLQNNSMGLLIKSIAFPHKVTLKEERIKDEFLDSIDIIFPSDDIALAGTVSMPRGKEGNKLLPSVLLVTGEGPYDRENAGLYTDISRELAKNGYLVLRFDRRGIGDSQGINMEVSLTDDIKDIENGLQFLINHERTDKDKLFIIAHGEGCSYLPLIDFSKFPVKGLIMLGVTKIGPFLDFDCEYIRENINTLTKIDRKFQKILESSEEETLNLIKNTKKEHAFVHRKRVFLKRMGELYLLKPLESFKKLGTPLLIIYGRKDMFGSLSYVNDIENALKEIELKSFSVIYFRSLGHLLGEVVTEKNAPKRYKMDKEALETIRDWLDKRCEDNLPPAPDTVVPEAPSVSGEKLTNT